MTQAPNTAAQNERSSRAAFIAECGDSGKVIRFKCMLHADQATKQK
jgi:hypothetical protein